MNLIELRTVAEARDELATLLIDCVESGASVGFVPPLPIYEAHRYWDGIEPDLASGSRLLVVARIDDQIVGAIQLALTSKKNGLHRAEVEKLMVHTSKRRSGLGRSLVERIEQLAKQHQRRLLVLDTRTGDTASALYRKCGYVEAGQIPDYAMNAEGQFEATTYFYKRL